MIVTLKASTKSNLKMDTLKLNHPLVPWIVKHAAAQITRFQVRQCGKTSYEQLKGRQSIEPLAQLGEIVMSGPPKTNKDTKQI